MSALDDVIGPTEGFEGIVPHLYLDTVGKVTCGVGFLVPDIAAAIALPLLRPTGVAATTGEKTAEFQRVKALPPGHMPSFYQTANQITLTPAAIAAMMRSREADFWAYLLKVLPDLPLYPEPAQLGLLDMMFNLGPSHFLQFGLMIAAVKQKAWARAAGQCNRPQCSLARNDWTRAQFLAAGRQGVA